MTNSHQARMQRVQQALPEHGLNYTFLSISPDLFYLTGYSAHVSERLHLLVIPPEGKPQLIVPEFERENAAFLSDWIEIVGWLETQNPIDFVRAALAPEDRAAPIRIAISDHTYAVFLLRIQEALPQARFIPASHVLAPMRRVKDAVELAIMKEAQDMAGKALTQLFEKPLAGRTERQAVADLRHIGELVGFDRVDAVIVGSGPNGALPHAAPSERIIASGDAVVIDFAAVHQGYYCDITRTVHVGPPSDEFRRVFEAVRTANHAALAAVRPGATCESIDRAARRVIADAGFGEYFIHRLGHGLGIEVHEEPYMVEGNQLSLEPGMVFTDEPGIYLPGRFGCRLEDVVAVTTDGGVLLTDYTHDLIVVE